MIFLHKLLSQMICVKSSQKPLRCIIFKGVVYVYILTATHAHEPPPPLVLKRVRAYGIKGQKIKAQFSFSF